MPNIPRISETEWEVMNVIWPQAPCTAREVIDRLQQTDPSWHPRTVKAFLSRLIQKKVLGFKPEGHRYLYRPLFRREDCADAASESFLGRVFGGSLRPMLAHFIERDKLTPEELRALRQLLEKSQ